MWRNSYFGVRNGQKSLHCSPELSFYLWRPSNLAVLWVSFEFAAFAALAAFAAGANRVGLLRYLLCFTSLVEFVALALFRRVKVSSSLG